MIDSESTWRGGEGQLELLMRGLLANGYAVSLCAPPRSVIWERARGIGVPCHPLSIKGGLDLRAAWGLREHLRQHRFDIIHCHSSHAHSVAFLARRIMGSRMGAGSDGPAVVVSRRVDFSVAKGALGSLKYRHGADAYLAISGGVRDVMVDCGIPEDRIRLVPSGIDLEKFSDVRDVDYLVEEFDLDDDAVIIGNVAALAPHKSQVDFIRAAKMVEQEISKAVFFIVGEGRLRRKLESLIEREGMRGKVILTGFRRDVLEIISLFDCFVLSSYLEGLCTSIMDAQSLGVPVVATRTGGVPDLVEDGVTGLLVPPRRPDLLASAIVRMLGESGLRERCIKAGLEKRSSYDYRNMVHGTMKAYASILHNRTVAEA